MTDDTTSNSSETNVVSSHQCPECGAYIVFEAHSDECSLKPRDMAADPVAVTKEAAKAKKNEYMRLYMRAYRAKKKEAAGADEGSAIQTG